MKSVILILLLFIVVYAKRTEVHDPDTGDVDRPCKFNDRKCIRSVVTKKGWCNNRFIKRQNADKPLKLTKQRIPLPSINCTLVQTNIIAQGLGNGKVVEFYFNEKADVVVFSVRFTDIKVNASDDIYYARDKKASIHITTDSYEHYSEFTTTTVLVGNNKVNPNRYTSTYIPKIPYFTFSDGVQDITNKEVQQLFKHIFSEPESAVLEIFASRGVIFEDFYVNNVICPIIKENC